MAKPVKILLIVLAVLLLLLGAVCIATGIIMKQQFGRGSYPDRKYYSYYWYDPDYSSTHKRENVQFVSGRNTLQGYLYGPEHLEDGAEPPKGIIVFAHGIGSGHEAYINTLMWFVDRGWVVFAYDATGCCTSEGDGSVGLVQSALDLDAALHVTEQDERLKGLPVCLLGHSWGGYAVCGVQNFDHNLTAACSISGYAYPLEMLQEGAVQTVGKPLAAVFRPFAAGYHNLTFGQYAGLNAVDGINHAGIPEFILHGEMDTTVPYEGISILSKQKQITNPHVRYETITGPYADHNLFFSSDAANAYKEEFNAQGKALEAQYNGDIPQEVRDAAYASRNLPLINEVNTELLQTIEQFYLDAIAGTDDTAATMRMME
ncbi:MAG: alpha/beta fold hydrolase [Oscillospiraceae bacterium]|nr:alpha/beta fold hydrolase [Oscillospiraceae bacterium]